MFAYNQETNTYQAIITQRKPEEVRVLLVDPSVLQQEFIDCFLHRWSIIPVLNPEYWVWRIDGKHVRFANPTECVLSLLQEGHPVPPELLKHALFFCPDPALFERMFLSAVVSNEQRTLMQQYGFTLFSLLRKGCDPRFHEGIHTFFFQPWEEKLGCSLSTLLGQMDQHSIIIEEHQPTLSV